MSKEGVIKNAKADYEAIKKYATEEAFKEMQKRIQPKLNEMLDKVLDESITVDADNATVTIDDNSIEVNKGDSKVVIDLGGATTSPVEDIAPVDNMEAPTSEEPVSDEESEGGFEVVSPNEPIQEDDMIFEVRSLNEEGEIAPEPTPDASAPAIDAVANPFQAIMDKLAGIEKKLEGGTTPAPAEGEVAVIDDADAQVAPEASATPELGATEEPSLEISPEDELPAPAAATPVATPSAPMIKEFNLQEYENTMEETNKTNDIVNEIMSQLKESGYEFKEENESPVDETMYELKMEDSSDDDSSDDMVDTDIDTDVDTDIDADVDTDVDAGKGLEVIMTLSDDNGDSSFTCTPNTGNGDEEYEVVGDGGDADMIDGTDGADEDSNDEEIEEMLGLGLGHGSGLRHAPKGTIPNVPHKEKIGESVKAQYESKLDELIKENNSLKKDIKEFEESFVELRNSIDEMQTFNAKLALANKLFLNGGLSTEDKIMVNESLDKANSVKEAEKIYQKIVKENKIPVRDNNVANKIKSKTTSVASSSQPLYESKEAKVLKEETYRSQILAGIRKPEDK